jgi:hypothetical protein
LAIASAVVAFSAGNHLLTIVLCALQTALVGLLAALGWTPERGWANVATITAAAWVPTFLISSWIYAAHPALLDVGRPAAAVATVDLSLVCLLAGYYWGIQAAGTAPLASPYVATVPMTTRRRRAAAWAALGCAGYGAFFAVTGGPVHYLNSISSEGALTTGRTYFLAAGLALTFVALTAACLRWSRGLRLPWGLRTAVAGAILLTATFGARQAIAVPLAELLLFYVLARHRPGLTMLVPVVLATGLIVVVVFGIYKRYGNYVIAHPGNHISRLDYMTGRGLDDFLHSYANNSADGVRLIALGEQVVPAHADPEYGKELLRLLLHPLPSGIRPAIPTAPAIEAAIYPSRVNSYAQPLVLVSYLQFTWVGIVAAFLILGRVMRALDRALRQSRRRRPSTLLLLVALAVHVETLLRIASANAVSIALIEIFGLWAVARTCEERVLTKASAVSPERRPVDVKVGVSAGTP